MNIFTVLNEGNSRLHETSMSAVLAYFLNPTKDHGLGDAFLKAFIGIPQMKQGVPKNISLANSVVELEKPISDNMYLDIEIILRDEFDKSMHYFIIENKIKCSSANERQLMKYYKAVRDDEEGYGDKKITVVFITPAKDNNDLEKEYDALELGKGDHKVWLRWQSNENEGDSIQKIIREKILKKEAVGEISPISEYVKHTLKAFAMHLDDTSVSVPRRSSGRKVVSQKELREENRVDVCGYEIVKNSKNQIYVRKNGDKVVAKNALRDIVRQMKLDVKEEQGGVLKTTYQFGAEILKALKNKGM